MKTRTVTLTLTIEVELRDELDDEFATYAVWEALQETDMTSQGLRVLELVGTGALSPEKGEIDETDTS